VIVRSSARQCSNEIENKIKMQDFSFSRSVRTYRIKRMYCKMSNVKSFFSLKFFGTGKLVIIKKVHLEEFLDFF
jgi:hypothetical protein